MAPSADPIAKPDGRRFLQGARRQLSRGQFDSLLVVMRELDDGDRTPEQAVAEVAHLFGPKQRSLLRDFAALSGVELDACGADTSSDSDVDSDEEGSRDADRQPCKQSVPSWAKEPPDALAAGGASFFAAAREKLPADSFSALFGSMTRLRDGKLTTEDALEEVRPILVPEHDNLYQTLYALLRGSGIGLPDGLHDAKGMDFALHGLESKPSPPQTSAVDGRSFFREAHSRVPQGLFDMLLAILKGLNSGLQTRKETLEEARKIFGEERSDLYDSLEVLLSDGGLQLDVAEGTNSSSRSETANAAGKAPSIFGDMNTRMMEGVQFASARRQAMETMQKLNDGQLSREEALQEARKVFGPERADLYNEFAALLGSGGTAELDAPVAESKPAAVASSPDGGLVSAGQESREAAEAAAAHDEGRSFFQKARGSLSREALGDFLRSQKRMNDGELTREGMLEEVRRIFGPELTNLFDEFAAMSARRAADDTLDTIPGD